MKTETKTTEPGTKRIPAAMPGAEMLPVASIRPSPTNPRKTYREAAIAEMAASIAEHGIVQPLIVRYIPQAYTLHEPDLTCKQWQLLDKAGKVAHQGTQSACVLFAGGEDGLKPYWELVAGHRRLKGALAAKLDLAPCIVRVLTDKEVLGIQLVENGQR